MRIHITGNAGAGKTTLANELGKRLRIPVFHMDTLIWLPGWQKVAPVVRERLEQEWIAHPEWIIEGVSPRVRAAAELVILLDVPRYTCTWRTVARCFRLMHRSRPELNDECPEIAILPRALGIVWRFRKVVRNPMLHELAGSSRLMVVRKPAEALEAVHALIASEGRG